MAQSLAFPNAFGPTDERTQLLAAAQLLYTQRGITAVSMDDLADYLGLPVETLLRWFPAQELLVSAIVDALADQLYQELHRHKQQSRNALAELLALCEWASKDQRVSYTRLLQQLQADFPAAWRRWEEHLIGFPLEHLRNNLRWGVLQEHYLPDVEADQLVKHWFELLIAAERAPAVAPHDLLEDLLAGVVTPAGALAMLHLRMPLSQ